MEKEKQKERENLPISVDQQIFSGKLLTEKVTGLMETLREICNCTAPTCQCRVTGVKYDLVSCIMEHTNKMKITLGKEIKAMNQNTLEKGLREVHGVSTSWAILSVRERLARAHNKKWLPPSQTTKETPQNKAVLNEDFLFIFCIINNIMDS